MDDRDGGQTVCVGPPGDRGNSMITINVFGAFEVRNGDRVLRGSGFGGRKPRQLLALLALSPGCPLSRDDIADALWEGRPPPGYVATVHGYVSLLRRGLSGIGADEVLVTSARGYMVPDHTDVDLRRGHRLLTSNEPEAVLDALEMAAHGLLVDEPFAAWAVEAQRDWDEAQTLAATRAAAVSRARGELGSAVRLARAARRSSPYCESALRELVRSLAQSGQAGRALEELRTACAALREELGVDPAPETERLYLELLGATPVRPAADVAELVRLLRDALTDDASLAAGDPLLRDVGRLILERAG